AITFLKQCDLLRIEDILPFFPDFALIDDFKTDLCQALDEYNEHIEQLKEEMDEATRSAENIRTDIHNLKNRSIVIHLLESASLARKNKIIQLRQRLDQNSGRRFGGKVNDANLTGLKEELEKELSGECPLCNDVIIKSVNKPFGDDVSLLVISVSERLRETTCYSMLPVSSKLVVFETRMKVRHALTALVQHGVQSAPLWDAVTQQFAGMFTVTDFINLLLHYYYHSSLEAAMLDMENLSIKNLKSLQFKSGVGAPIVSLHPMKSLFEASRILVDNRLYRLPLVDDSQNAEVIVSVVTEFKILRHIAENYQDIPVARKTLRELGLGTYTNLKTATADTPLITVLNMFVKDKISAVPIQDEKGLFIDIYEKYDVLLLTKEGSSTDLSIPLSQALAGRSTEFAGIHTCAVDETMGNIMDTIRRMTVHRFIVLEDDVCKGILSLSDILRCLLKS
ncbi:AMP-activated serine/threonine-protein kinase regulatory subunit, partial [Chytriomyces hyalinus]